MAVTANAVGTFFRGAATPVASSASINVPAASTALWVQVTVDDATTAITAPTWNGTSTTLIGSVNTTDNLTITKLYGLVNPASGSNSLSVAFSGGAPTGVHVCAVSFSGSLSSTVAGTFTGFVSQANNTAGSSNTVTVTSSSGDLAIAAGNGNNSSTYTINQTNIYNQALDFSDAASRAAGAATVVFTGTLTGLTATNCIAGCNIVQSAGSSAPFYKLWDRPGFDLPGITPQHYVRNPSQFPNPIPFQDQQQRHTRQVPLVGPPQSLPLNINLFTNPIPFKQTDWNIVEPFFRVPQQIQPYNNSVYSVVIAASPFYTQDFTTSHIIPDWAPPPQYTNLVLQNFSTPFRTQDFSKPFVPTPAKQDQQALNVNIFTNPIPFAQYDWSTTKQRTISPDVNLLNIVLLNPVVTGTPFTQLSWPKTSGVPSAPSDFYNMVLYNIDVTAPFAQYDWSHGEFLPSVPSSPIVLNTNLFTNPIPFNQLDWSKYYQTVTPRLDSLPNIVLLNPTSSPFFYQDFSRPFVPARPVISAQSVNTNLFTNPVPLNQIDWSKPYRIVPIASDQNSLPNIILYQPVPSNPSNPLGIYSWADLYKYVTLYPTTPALLQNLTLILPPPPPDTGPVGGWRWIDGVMRMREKQLDRRDQNASAVMLGKLGGLARAQALTTRQRSNIASKAAQVRWNPPAKKR